MNIHERLVEIAEYEADWADYLNVWETAVKNATEALASARSGLANAQEHYGKARAELKAELEAMPRDQLPEHPALKYVTTKQLEYDRAAALAAAIEMNHTTYLRIKTELEVRPLEKDLRDGLNALAIPFEAVEFTRADISTKLSAFLPVAEPVKEEEND